MGYYSRRLMINILACIVMHCAYSQQPKETYPYWFLFPTEFPGMTIGMSYKESNALTDAQRMYCLYNECFVDGTITTYQTTYISYLKSTDYFYYFSSEDYEKIKNSRFHLIDGFVLNTLTEDHIMAFSCDSNLVLNKELVSISKLAKPPWVKETSWIDNGFVYGVGLFTCSGNENDAWKTSEERAFFNILTSISVKIYSIQKIENNYNRININSEITQEIIFKIRNIETLKRWVDKENQLFYTLVRINEKNIISLLKKNQ